MPGGKRNRGNSCRILILPQPKCVRPPWRALAGARPS